VEGEEAMIMLENIGESDCHEFWFEILKHFQNVRLDTFVVMPNHIHGILLIGNSEVGNKNADAERGGETPPLRRTMLCLNKPFTR
jgi:REP element-mobilizing transposase RayT